MRVFILGVLLPVMTVPAFAQTGVQDKLMDCANVPDGAQRLACFDALTVELKQASDTSFGAQAAKPVKPAEPDRVSLAVSALDKGADGKLRFTMENGQVWRQVDTTRLPSARKGPWTAEIRKAAFGTFLLSLNNGGAIRVERVK
jgi:hypothetical protein